MKSRFAKHRTVFACLSRLILLLTLFASPAGAQVTSKLWGVSGEAWDPEGFLKDFTDAGYMNSAAIPDRPVTTNVEDFGADGSDDLDDTEAFRAAIRAVPEDGVIFIPNGRYIISDYIHVAAYDPDSTDRSNKFPNSPFTIFNKSNFTLRGEDMAETKIVFPQRMGEIYQRLSRPALMDYLYSNHEQFNNDEFKNRFGIPLEYDFSQQGGDSDFIFIRSLQEAIINYLAHEYSQSFTKVGSFFEFKGVTDTNIENLSFLFDDRQRWEHQENTGGNPLSFISASHCYVRNVYIRNADSGIFNERGENITFQNIILDQYRHRFEERYPTSGHNGIKMVGTSDCLVHNVWFTGPWWHAFDLNGSNSGTVLSKIKGPYLNLVYHGGYQTGNLYTDFDGDTTRFLTTGKHSLETYWGMQSPDEALTYNSPEKSAELKDVLVGVNTTDPSELDSPDYWHETIDPEALDPLNIYLAQMAYRSRPLPEDMPFSMGMLPRESGEPLYIFPSESPSVSSVEDKRDINFYSESPELFDRAPN